MASRHSRDRGSNQGNEPPTQAEGSAEEASTRPPLEGDAAETSGAAGAGAQANGTQAGAESVDLGTGEIRDGAPSKEGEVSVDVVGMLRKLSAREIIKSKAYLRFTRKFQADEKSPDGGFWTTQEPRDLYTIFGTASGTATGESDFGPFMEFTGTFEAIRLEDRERFAGTRAFLQQPAQDMLFNQLKKIQAQDPNASVTFAFQVGVKPSLKWLASGDGTSYEYTVKSYFRVQRHDALAELRASVMQCLPAPQKLDMTLLAKAETITATAALMEGGPANV